MVYNISIKKKLQSIGLERDFYVKQFSKFYFLESLLLPVRVIFNISYIKAPSILISIASEFFNNNINISILPPPSFVEVGVFSLV